MIMKYTIYIMTYKYIHYYVLIEPEISISTPLTIYSLPTQLGDSAISG